MLCNVSFDFNFIQWPCEFVWRVRKPVQCNRITNYHAKLKTKATTQNGAPISKCKRNEKPFATSIEWNRTANGSGVERRRDERMENLCSGYCEIFIAVKQKYGRNCTMLFYVSYDGWWWCAHCTRTFRAAIYRKLYASSALLSIAWCIMAWIHFGWLNSSFCQLSLQATIDYVHCIFTVAISVTSTLTSRCTLFYCCVRALCAAFCAVFCLIFNAECIHFTAAGISFNAVHFIWLDSLLPTSISCHTRAHHTKSLAHANLSCTFIVAIGIEHSLINQYENQIFMQ